MRNLFRGKANHILRSIGCLCILFLAAGSVHAQQSTTVLPNNAAFSGKTGPQGALRYQRGFYLITPAEMSSSGLTNGMNVNSIGFTLAGAQSDTTNGGFKVYLQNTGNTVSRVDSNWVTVSSIAGNSYSATNLFPGSYEWQVKTDCPSGFSLINSFSNNQLAPCNVPTGLSTTNVTDVSATFNWVAPATGAIQYDIEYSRLDVVNWIKATTAGVSYTATGLVSNKSYQWRIRTKCSTDSSDQVYSSFTTESTDVCNEPSALVNSLITNTTAKLKWTGASGAIYYMVRFKRTGTNAWDNRFAFADSINIVGLSSGTAYDWQVKTVCSLGSGAFVGSTFTTTGAVTCFAPQNLSTNTITNTSAVFSWSAVAGATSYELRYRRKESIKWANVITPMTLVHNDTLKLKKTSGPYDLPFLNGSAFTYTGGGVYVAWEYRRPLGALTTSNISLSTSAGTVIKDINGLDSIKYILSFTDRGDSSIADFDTLITVSNLRPETRFGSSSLKDSVAVVAVYALGKTVPRFQSPTPVSALIANRTASGKTYAVTMTVKAQQSGATRFTASQNLTVEIGRASCRERV